MTGPEHGMSMEAKGERSQPCEEQEGGNLGTGRAKRVGNRLCLQAKVSVGAQRGDRWTDVNLELPHSLPRSL